MSPKVILLTGATGGLGKAMAELIAAREEKLVLLATSRGAFDLGVKTADPDSKVVYLPLDVTSETSIKSLQDKVGREYGQVDVMILNAGGSPFEKPDNSTFGSETVQKTLDLNYHAAKNMIDAFAPLMPAGGHIAIVSSTASWQLAPDSPLIKAARAKELSTAELDKLAKVYVHAAGKPSDDGWLKKGFKPAYATSKAFQNLLAETKAREYPQLLINAGCPGITATGETPKTDPMGQPIKWTLKTPAEGARVPLRLAFGDIYGSTGKFWANASTGSTGTGEQIDDWPGREIIWPADREPA